MQRDISHFVAYIVSQTFIGVKWNKSVCAPGILVLELNTIFQ
jgi:hypothetical protein